MTAEVGTFAAVRSCAIALLAGVVLHAVGVTAGNGTVIDWREVKSGETLQTDGDAFDTAYLFVTLVGAEEATAAATRDHDIGAAPLAREALPSLVHPDIALRVVTHSLARVGWEVRSAEIDLVRGRAVVRLFRGDGRWLYLSADAEGRASVERWHRDPTVERDMGGVGPRFDAFKDRFLGRVRCNGARSALRVLCDYVAENPAPGHAALPASDVRNILRPLLALDGQADETSVVEPHKDDAAQAAFTAALALAAVGVSS